MPVEPVACRACSRRFSPKLALCPFCNAPRDSGVRERCTECGRERAAGLTTCPFCHPEEVAPAIRPAVPDEVVANAVRRALEVAPPAPPDDEPWVNRKVLFASGIATAVGLVGALVCARHYDRIGPDGIGRVARAIAFLPVVFLGAWMRWTWRSAPLGFARLRSMVTTYLLVTAPCALAIYTMSLLLNGWTADAPMDALCSIESAEGSEARIACRTSSEMALRGEVRTGLLRARVPSARAFVAPVRRGGLGVWLIDVGGAREPRPVDVVPGGAESDWPSSPSRVLAPGVPFPGVSDDDPRPLRNGPGGR